MKVFVSWSGELSKLVAKELSDWLPSIIQSVEVFYSPEDIQKGENWDSRLTKELEDSKYGIVCLTKENVLAPWIHFEAGALSKSLDSRTSALMIDIVTSDIQGPLSRFQATRCEKEDFYQLVCDINEASENQISEKVLKNSFEAIWDKLNGNIQRIIKERSKNSIKEKNKETNKETNGILEELLQLLRKQDAILNNPEKLFPKEYFEYLNTGFGVRNSSYVEKYITQFFNNILKKMYVSLENVEYIANSDMLLQIVEFAIVNYGKLRLDIPMGMLNRMYKRMKRYDAEKLNEIEKME